MSLKSSNKIEKNKYELEIAVDKDKFETAVQKAYRKKAKSINVPGFRKGKAPRHIIEKYYGGSVFYDEAINSLYPDEYSAAVKEAGIEPVDRADVEIVSAGKDGLVMKAKVTVKPDVELGEYKKIKAVKKIYDVADKDIDAEIERVRNRNARILTVDDRPVEKGDIVKMDFEGFMDGKAFKGGSAKDQQLEIGSGSFIPGFEDGMIGHSTGEKFDIDVTFPEDYHVKELAGKPAVFKVELKEIRKRELPGVDDDFAKDVSEFDTLAEYREDIKKHLKENNDKKSDGELEDAILSKIVDGMKVDVPEVMFESAIDNMVNDFDYRLQMQGLNVQAYLQYTGMKMDDFRKTFRKQAERQVKTRLALEKIASLEKFEISEKDISDEYDKFAKRYNVTSDKVKSAFEEDDIKQDIAVGKALTLVKESAVVTEEKAVPEDEKEEKATSEDKEDKKEVKSKATEKKPSGKKAGSSKTSKPVSKSEKPAAKTGKKAASAASKPEK